MNTLCASDTDWTIFADGAPLEERDYSATSSYSIFCVGDENRLLHCDRRDAYCSSNAAVKCFTRKLFECFNGSISCKICWLTVQ